MSDDAEFDAFLKGEGELSHRLHAMQQAAPSAALDAAIVERARELMAQESARPVAANDAGDSTPAPRLGWRWRVPAGIAAIVLAGVLARQSFQSSADLGQGANMPQEADQPVQLRQAPAVAPAAEPAAAPAPAQPPILERAAKRKVPMANAYPAPVKQDKAVPAAPPAPAAMDEYKAAPAPVAGYAPAAPAAVAGKLEASELSRARSDRAKPSLRTAAQWLATIETLLEEGRVSAAAHEWRAFRQAYPDYPVPQTTEERIKAIDQ